MCTQMEHFYIHIFKQWELIWLIKKIPSMRRTVYPGEIQTLTSDYRGLSKHQEIMSLVPC